MSSLLVHQQVPPHEVAEQVEVELAPPVASPFHLRRKKVAPQEAVHLPSCHAEKLLAVTAPNNYNCQQPHFLQTLFVVVLDFLLHECTQELQPEKLPDQLLCKMSHHFKNWLDPTSSL
jgi:hypothetical protein